MKKWCFDFLFRQLELPLLQAERCWAYAMQLKEEAVQDNRKKFSLRNKLRKAAAYSVAFEQFMEVIVNSSYLLF